MNLDDTYVRTLERYPTMSADEQATVAARFARTRDPSDADRLMLGNLRLVVKIARELGPHRSDLMDLVQEGNAGLMHAIRRFDPSRGVKLTTYAAWWIRACIMRHIMATSRMVSMASTREGRRRFFDRTLPGPDRSLDAPVRRDDGDDSIRARVDLIADDDANRPDVRCEEGEYKQRVHDAFAAFPPTLDDRGRGILEMRLLPDKPARLADVGKRFAVSGERIRQLEFRVRSDLRAFVARSLEGGEPAAA
ncbi:MAG TPA: sigma-70 family RNA polymerase sigma factor [Polyangia bacterium]|jgi:RNA polymerase sigma-32 factor|nr:sigma-70 family RNA polymerase sigma factor [Polyangia bacterium]